jgi:hypothetical protein
MYRMDEKLSRGIEKLRIGRESEYLGEFGATWEN